MAAWSTAGNALVFVQSNTMYYKASVTANPILVTLARNVHESVGFTNYIYERKYIYSISFNSLQRN